MAEDIAVIDIIVPPTSVIEVVTGMRGDTGPPGPPGGSTSVFFYRVDAQSTAPNDPGTGKLRYNTAVQADATALYVDWLTAEGFDAHVYFGLVHVTRLAIQDKDLAVTYQVFDITGPVVEHPDWFEVPVAFVSATGAGDFSHNQNVALVLLADAGAALPTAPLGQVLSSQGDGADPVFRPNLLLIDPTGPPDQRRWQIKSSGTDFIIDCQNEAGTSANHKVFISAYNGSISLSAGGSFEAANGGASAAFLRPIPDTVAGHVGHRSLGNLVTITDSTTKTPGAVISGGGAFTVLAWWTGTNWIVVSG